MELEPDSHVAAVSHHGGYPGLLLQAEAEPDELKVGQDWTVDCALHLELALLVWVAWEGGWRLLREIKLTSFERERSVRE